MSKKRTPKDEMLLAEAIAVAKSKKLKHTKVFMFGLDGDPSNPKMCCALGAIALIPGDKLKSEVMAENVAFSLARRAGLNGGYIAWGNDIADIPICNYNSSVAFGMAFRDVMRSR
jgi:hypothetical protein